MRDVRVTGATATTRVADGEGRVRTLELVRERGAWKVSALGESG